MLGTRRSAGCAAPVAAVTTGATRRVENAGRIAPASLRVLTRSMQTSTAWAATRGLRRTLRDGTADSCERCMGTLLLDRGVGSTHTGDLGAADSIRLGGTSTA